MSSKYHVKVKVESSRFAPVPKFNAIEVEGCLGCLKCVKRDSCVYDVYKNRKFDAKQIVDTADVDCISCMRCVQECKKNIISRAKNPQYSVIGNEYWKPEILTSIWKQAETGKIPVSGAGYRGPFAGAGFDEMWTDMSEIVRPTRDGIHGREYISTSVELGRRPARLEFDGEGKLITKVPHFIEIPIPVVLDIPEFGFVDTTTRQAIAQAAKAHKTFAITGIRESEELSLEVHNHLIIKFDPAKDDVSKLKGMHIVELSYADDINKTIGAVRAVNPKAIISVRVKLDENAADRVSKLAADGCEILHCVADSKGMGIGKRSTDFISKLIKEIHFRLLKDSKRDQVTLMVTGGMAMAEHMAKAIICGADVVGLDFVLLAAMQCRLCPDCDQRSVCPVELDHVPISWGSQRIMNLLDAWHSQLIEVMGAMGLREVRRLRGELGRAMFFEDLERDSFSPVFGTRVIPLEESLKVSRADSIKTKVVSPTTHNTYPPVEKLVANCPSRYRNRMSKYKVVRTLDCISCGKCVQVCAYGVHKKAGSKMAKPVSFSCRGPEFCINKGAYCVTECPVNALRVGPDALWQTFGDSRWTSDLLASTWIEAETGLPPQESYNDKTGASGGGFDRIDIVFPKNQGVAKFEAKDVDLSVKLNRSNDGRPEVKIGIPFYGGGMSYGSISLGTMIARAKAWKAFNSFTCSGEGGYPEELKPYDDHVITQVATGLFGVKEETIQRVRIVEFKYAQGAKPGLGGHLLGDKVTPAVAKMREAVVGTSLFSPFPFHSVYSVEDHKKHVDWIRHVNPKALVSVKVSTPSDVDMVAVGSYYAGAHIIHLDGSYGGTGAAPDIAKKNIAMPIEYAIGKVHRFLVAEGIRDKITLVVSGGLRSPWDLAKAIAMGADCVVIGTAEMVSLECIRCAACESGRGCPRGIATTDPTLGITYDVDWASQRLINLFNAWSVQLQDILWRLGMKSVGELVGRSDLLVHLDYDNKQNKQGK